MAWFDECLTGIGRRNEKSWQWTASSLNWFILAQIWLVFVHLYGECRQLHFPTTSAARNVIDDDNLALTPPFSWSLHVNHSYSHLFHHAHWVRLLLWLCDILHQGCVFSSPISNTLSSSEFASLFLFTSSPADDLGAKSANRRINRKRSCAAV